MARLSADGLTLIRGERCLFQDLSLSLERGELLLLEGANGSGKTSLLRALAGMLSVETGEVCWNDESIANQRQEFHGSLVWLSHRSGLKGDLSPLENLQFERSLRAQSDRDPSEVYERLGIARFRNMPLRLLSAGQQRRVALARLLFADAPLWLLDEPFTNLDRAGRELVTELTEEHLAGGGLCVIAAHQDVPMNAPVKKVRL